ncbi:TIR domain-containing protein [Streptomyces sp. S3(2020)]|uniref:TIR domain-containing protein n=1 Tax=Streptomyces sp. S3(2020) TaxID=2732044 RepID=UPI001489429A|nr:TIR domain-containing protein [Streptomyces sp. S3(2020)]NNN29804.1 TIR domain-containing protein [Streptomyces sp. S3(2020)]
MAGVSRIPAYFSHSYWAEDRELNEHFWKLFWDEGFTFAVDPKTNPLSPTHLELMMDQSSCFVGVVTHRPEERRYRASPFMVHEHGLALQAQKSRLVFMETGVSAGFFPVGSEERVVFNRRQLPRADRVKSAIERLAGRSGPSGGATRGLLGTVGLILPDDAAYHAAEPYIRRAVEDVGYRARTISLQFLDPFEFDLAVDECDFIVVDTASPFAADWVFPKISGRFRPMLKLFHEPPDGRYEPRPSVLLSGEALRAAEPADRIAVHWSDPEELADRLQDLVARFYQPRLEFESHEEGVGYFRSIGRAQGSIFLSNARGDDTLAQRVGRSLELHNHSYFHYLRRNTIELGADWRSQLYANVAACRVFLPLISQHYWASEYCKEEYNIAERLRADGRLVILPYFLGPGAAKQVSFQGRSIGHLPQDEQVAVISRDVDSEFVDRLRLEQRVTADGQRCDVAVVALLPEAHEALRRHLDTLGSITDTVRHGTGEEWIRAGIEAVGRSSAYEVVVVQPCEGKDGVSNAVAATIEEYQPETVVFVGACCAVAPDLVPGDVVISNRLHGYAYDELEQTCLPRPDRSHLAHEGVAALGDSMRLNYTYWTEKIYERPPGSPRTDSPRVVVGPVASGDTPVDGSGDPALRPVLVAWPGLAAVEIGGSNAARAVTHARRAGRTQVSFSMVCAVAGTATDGISVNSARPEQEKPWKQYAADVAATLIVEAIRLAWPSPPRRAG